MEKELMNPETGLLPGEVEHVVDEDFELAERLPSCVLKQEDYSGVDSLARGASFDDY